MSQTPVKLPSHRLLPPIRFSSWHFPEGGDRWQKRQIMDPKPPTPTSSFKKNKLLFCYLDMDPNGVSLQGVQRTVVTVRQHIKQLHPRQQQAAHQLCTGAKRAGIIEPRGNASPHSCYCASSSLTATPSAVVCVLVQIRDMKQKTNAFLQILHSRQAFVLMKPSHFLPVGVFLDQDGQGEMSFPGSIPLL